MADYNVWADLFDTWQSTSDGIKALLIITPPAFAAGVLALLLRHRTSGHHPSSSDSYDIMPPGSAPEIMDRVLLASLSDLQKRLQQANDALKYQSLQPLEDRSKMSDDETRERVRQIVMEEYRRNSHPSEALQRVRQFLVETNRGRS
ncbi:hypothetical protein H4S14_000642 [Agrobacterium vitis]|nr:hypothetical protein [Agrobacterium vitis]MBE1436915.1 hypothetical protein [Agrobacterium vitis]